MPFLVTGTVVAKKRQQKLEGPVITVNPRFEKTCVLLDWSIVFLDKWSRFPHGSSYLWIIGASMIVPAI